MSIVQKAFSKAQDLHSKQKRVISQAPYIVHLLEVVRILLYEGASDELLAAGFLHDSLEDTHYSESQLRREFGDVVSSLVLFCTEPDNNPTKTTSEMKESWKRRKQHTIDLCFRAGHDELMLLCADKLANILSVRDDIVLCGEAVWEYFDAPKSEQEWYYVSLSNVFSSRLPHVRMTKLFLACVHEVFKT